MIYVISVMIRIRFGYTMLNSLSQVVRNDWHDDHVQHVVQEEGDGHRHEDQLALSGGLLEEGKRRQKNKQKL